MIKSNITVEVNSTELGGVLIVPSAVFTSTVQEEELDLTKTPNFQIVIGKGDEIKDTVEVSFTVEEVEYTANMKVVNRNGSTVTLQYVDGLTAEDAPEPIISFTINPGDLTNGTYEIDNETYDASVVVEKNPGNTVTFYSKNMTTNQDTFEFVYAADTYYKQKYILNMSGYAFDTLTFVELDSTYRNAIMDNASAYGQMFHGRFTEDENNLILKVSGNAVRLNADFSGLIAQTQQTMTLKRIEITVKEM